MSGLAEQILLVVCAVVAITSVSVIVVLFMASFEDVVDMEPDDQGEADLFAIGLVVLFVTAIVGAIGFGIANATHVEHMTCTVTDKDRTTSSSGSDARLYTEDCGTLHVGDSLLSWHFNSADTYASIKPGRTYDVTTRGYRVPFLSMFPNVVEATEVSR